MVHVQFLDEIESAMGGLVRLVVAVQQNPPTTRLELTTHEERVVVAGSRCVVDMFGDIAERRSRAPPYASDRWASSRSVRGI